MALYFYRPVIYFFLHFAGSKLYVGKEKLFRLGYKFFQFYASRAQPK